MITASDHRRAARQRRSTAARVLARVGDVALWAGAVLGSCALVLVVLGLTLGIRPLIFRSGSMAPTIPAGSLGLAREVAATSVHRGDVVTVPVDGSYVTHRIVDRRHDSGTTELRLRGDANNTADSQPYHVTRVDKLLFSVPHLGYPVAWLSHPPGVFVLAGYAAIMLAVIFRRRGDGSAPGSGRGDDHGRHVAADGRGKPRNRAVSGARHVARAAISTRSRATVAVLLLGSAMALRAAPSWAIFTDSVPISGSTLKTYTVPKTTLSCGALGVLSVTFNWTAVAGATNYTLHYGSNGTKTLNTTSTTHTFVTAISGGTAWVTVNRAFGSVTWSSADSNKRSYTVAVVGLCA